MRQCLLQRGQSQQVAWIQSIFAVQGSVLRLHDQSGWQVKAVYGPWQERVETPHGYLAGGVWHR